ncbi:MAG: nicotinamide riboside transporter PnuC [Chitinophagaceae bacterium]
MILLSNSFWLQLYNGLINTGYIEYIAVFAGIISVWFSKKESIWVYPTGLVNTLLFIYLSYEGNLIGEASVNLYYSIMSLYGWYKWVEKNADNQTFSLKITKSTTHEWLKQLLFFLVIYVLLFTLISILKEKFAPNAIPWADALASASAYTGMWLMTRKKLEHWYWWIVTNLVSIPLYVVKGYVFTGVQFLVLLFLAVAGLIEWKNKLANQ